MTPTDIVVWIGVIATIVCAVYAVLGYYRSPGAATDSRADPSAPPRRPWVPIICVALVWAAVGIDYFTRPEIAAAVLIDYGIDNQAQFHGVAQFRNWKDYQKFKGMLITRTVFADRDRMTDDWIAKSIAYTIDKPLIVMVAITKGEMRFAVNLPNLIEYNFVVIPAEISPAQIRTLGDVLTLGGKILAVNSQGGLMGAPPAPPSDGK